jgi:hypothetical protein
MRITFEITDELREQARSEGYGASEDYDRDPKERDFDGWVGDLGELVFAEILEEKTDWEYEYLGGKTEPDFIVEGCSVDVKTRTVIDENKRDLIIPADLKHGFHDFYVLLRCVYEEDDWEELDRHERTVEALEFIGLWDSATVEKVSEPFAPPWVQGRASSNYRDTVICDYGTHQDLMEMGPMMRTRQAQPAD